MHKDLHKNAGNGLKKALFLENFPRADSYLLPPPPPPSKKIPSRRHTLRFNIFT